ncbi:ABC transporter ATP-binding protein [Microbacterium paludicola]|uniref:ABC transporter ATP-binding protein n=1 Tax=Microbacterium paludicola TaxID=300019 RepID=A0A4Y9FRM3_9MICO|nr:ABC transporter ATP-binding protein [Microbacterium paludicola]MBF0817521.1 ABC transporter ATP-binding protein [Microbacterium paludicola]TFU30919.1 ABC transporter ATP-binding protein [Microbacterium paludicola]
MAEVAIRARGLGIKFRRNRRGRRSLRDMFGRAENRTRPDEFWAFRNVSFRVEQGEGIAVVGRNGQGKSTLLKLVAGVLKPDEGRVTVNGGVAPLIEITGGFEANLTVRENVNIVAGLHGMPRKEINRRFDSILDFAELEKFVNTPFKHLSSGMKARLAFAVVSELDEPILLVDEVLAVGDKTFRDKCYNRIEGMMRDGKTLFFVGHSASNMRRFTTRGLYLDRGTLQMDAPIEDVLKQYEADYPNRPLTRAQRDLG